MKTSSPPPRTLTVLAVLSVGAAGVLMGCSGGSGGAGDAGLSDARVNVDGGEPGTGEGGGASEGGAAADGGANGPIIAQLSFGQNVTDDNGTTSIAVIGGALFIAAVDAGGAHCTNTPVAGCKVLACPALAGGGAPSENGGTVTISTPTIATDPVVLTLGDAGVYTGNELSTQAFSAGDDVTFQTSGAPGFPAIQTTVKAPSKIGISSPTVPATGNLALRRDQDLTVQWDVADMPATGTVQITLTAPFTTGGLTTAACTFPASDGQGTIPKAVFATFTTGPGTFSSSCISQVTVPIGDGTAVVTVGEGGDSARVTFQ